MLGLKYADGASKASKTTEPFVTTKSVLVVALGCLGLCLFGHILHTQHDQRMAHTAALQHHRLEALEKAKIQKEEVAKVEAQQKPQEAPKVEAPKVELVQETKEHVQQTQEQLPAKVFEPGYLTPELYSQCNPSVGYMLYETVGGPNNVNTGKGAETALDGGRCGVDEATVIRDALDRNNFDFQSVTPTPYIYPPFLQSAMFDLMHTSDAFDWVLQVSLQAHEQNSTGDETLLAQFFTWGLPVPSSRLRKILGDKAIIALTRCHAIRSCATEPGLWFSSVQLFPVPMTGVIVANDFPVLNYEMSNAPVGITTVENLGLTNNAPHTVRGTVLDMSSNNGVHGIVAAVRGAESVTFVHKNPRVLRFAQFGAYLNKVGDKMLFTQGAEYAMGATPTFGFDLLLANPSYSPTLYDDGEMELREAIGMAASHLSKNGSFAFVTEIHDPKDLPNRLCQDMGLGGFSGTVVFKNPPIDVQTYSKTATFNLDTSKNLTDSEMRALKGASPQGATSVERAARLVSLGVAVVAESIVYGWRTPKQVVDRGCGVWDWVGLTDPWDREVGKTLEQRSCYYNQHRRDSCPHVL